MPRTDLTERQIEELRVWATQQSDRLHGEQVAMVIAELLRSRERESATRFLMGIEGEV